MLILEAKKNKSNANSTTTAPKPSMAAGPKIILNDNLLNWRAFLFLIDFRLKQKIAKIVHRLHILLIQLLGMLTSYILWYRYQNWQLILV